MQVAGWSKTRHPKGVASSGLAFQDTRSDRWGQQQGILGRGPTQKSGRAGIGILRSVFEGEDPLQLAIHGKEVWQGLEEGRRKEVPSWHVVGDKSRPSRGPRAE